MTIDDVPTRMLVRIAAIRNPRALAKALHAALDDTNYRVVQAALAFAVEPALPRVRRV
jgi:hypothetical protein